MQASKVTLAVMLVAAAVPFAIESVEATDGCYTYPIGRCGAYDRETVVFCYRMVGVKMVDATDHHVVALGSSEGVTLADNNAKGVAYIRLTPPETFAADPAAAPAPTGTLVLESNEVRGVQLLPFQCAHFWWWADGECWLGPYNIQPWRGTFPIDNVVV